MNILSVITISILFCFSQLSLAKTTSDVDFSKIHDIISRASLAVKKSEQQTHKLIALDTESILLDRIKPKPKPSKLNIVIPIQKMTISLDTESILRDRIGSIKF